MKGTMLKCGYAMVKKETDKEIEYDSLKWLESEKSGGREYDYSPKGDLKEIYADGKVVFATSQNNGYDGSITMIDLIDDIAEDWYRQKKGSGGERIEIADNRKMPPFALVQIEETTDGDKITTVYPYVYARQRPNKKGKTSEDGAFDPEFVQHQIAIRPRPTDKYVCWEVKGGDEFEIVPEAPKFEESEVKKNQEEQ